MLCTHNLSRGYCRQSSGTRTLRLCYSSTVHSLENEFLIELRIIFTLLDNLLVDSICLNVVSSKAFPAIAVRMSAEVVQAPG